MIYGVTVGSGKFADMALCQLWSLHEFTLSNQNTIVANCPPDEWDEISQAQQEEIRSLATVTHEPAPIPEYKLSSFYATGKRCVETADGDEWIVLLDTDTLVLGGLAGAVSEANTLALKPADLHFSYGGLSESKLRECYQIADVEYPDTTIFTTVDGKAVPPYWNGGVVYFRDQSVLDQWIETTELLQDHYLNEFFIEQLSLSIVSTLYNVKQLGEKYNYPLPHRYWVPSSTRVLHYHNPIELPWVLNPEVYTKLRHIRVFDVFGWGKVCSQLKRFGIRLGRSRFRF